MNEWTNVWLAIIAISTLLMALIQVAVIVVGAVIARRLQGRVSAVEAQMQPLVERINTMSADAVRISALAVQQAEKADVAVSSAARRLDQTLAVVQNAVVAPAREGMALAAAVRAAVGSLKQGARRRKAAGEDDDALFIG